MISRLVKKYVVTHKAHNQFLTIHYNTFLSVTCELMSLFNYPIIGDTVLWVQCLLLSALKSYLNALPTKTWKVSFLFTFSPLRTTNYYETYNVFPYLTVLILLMLANFLAIFKMMFSIRFRTCVVSKQLESLFENVSFFLRSTHSKVKSTENWQILSLSLLYEGMVVWVL